MVGQNSYSDFAGLLGGLRRLDLSRNFVVHVETFLHIDKSASESVKELRSDACPPGLKATRDPS